MPPTDTFLIWLIGANSSYITRLCHQLSLNPAFEVRRFSTLPLAQATRPAAGQLPQALLVDTDGQPEVVWRSLLYRLRERYASAWVAVLASQFDGLLAAELQQQGPACVLEKNSHGLDQLWQELSAAYQQPAAAARPPAAPAAAGARLLGEHPGMQQVRELIAKAAHTSITVSITGETGTGKEVVAQAIHAQSARHRHPFVAINMAAIPRELLESELFGHEKGAFTGAATRRVGRFEEASGGTLFLDEIADLELPLQAKLLRALQERSITRLGGQQAVAFDVRLVVATHRSLAAEMQAGRFRADLYYRLLGLPIELPPLRQRGHDILLLAEAFARQFSDLNNLPPRPFSAGAQRQLLRHPFPGNVRELRAVVELAAVLAEGSSLEEQDLRFPPIFAEASAPAQPDAREPAMSLREQTLAIMQRSLRETGGDVVAAARRLQVGRSTLYRLIQSGHLSLP